MTRKQQLFVVLCCLFASVVVISNALAAKLVQAPFVGVALPIGTLTYPLTFLLTDLVSELYSEWQARFMVLLAFAMNILLVACTEAAVRIPAHEAWGALGARFGLHSLEAQQQAYASVFSINSTLVGGSLLAYAVAQLLDVRIFTFFKKLTNGRHLWLRNNASTLTSQLVDTGIVTAIQGYGMGLNWETGLALVTASYAYKALFALADTPVLYLAVYTCKQWIAQAQEHYA